MKKGFFALCFVLFQFINIQAQDNRTPQNNTSIKATDATILSQPTTSDASTVPTDAMETKMEQAAPQGPMFPDSLMKGYEVEIFQNVSKTADLVNIKYKDLVAKAKSGDVGSMHKLLDFHRIVDGVDGLNHAVTCLEMLPLMGDASFASAVSLCQPKLKKLIVDRLILAQGRTKKTFLRQSLTNIAPLTWQQLTGEKKEPAPAAENIPQPSTNIPAATTSPSIKQ
ncbi:MAG: hypothetical protein OHK0019_20810 [Saprospiraceae bacterium]